MLPLFHFSFMCGGLATVGISVPAAHFGHLLLDSKHVFFIDRLVVAGTIALWLRPGIVSAIVHVLGVTAQFMSQNLVIWNSDIIAFRIVCIEFIGRIGCRSDDSAARSPELRRNAFLRI